LVMEKKDDRKKKRLNKIIAESGIASRRGADKLISSGLVMVNGLVEKRVGSKASWGIDSIKVDGHPIPDPPKKIYLLLHKPFGYVSTLYDPQRRPIVRDLVTDIRDRVYPVGRLDFDSSGLLILTNDGELAFRLMHPRFHIPRTYNVVVEGLISNKSVDSLRGGIILDDGPTHPARVKIIERTKRRSILRITMFEGRSREIRRMCEAMGHKTLRLIRLRYGNLDLGDLMSGTYRHLTNVEVKGLRLSVGLD
jgi:23S rRNA pseudouridine2605 synthase